MRFAAWALLLSCWVACAGPQRVSSELQEEAQSEEENGSHPTMAGPSPDLEQAFDRRNDEESLRKVEVARAPEVVDTARIQFRDGLNDLKRQAGTVAEVEAKFQSLETAASQIGPSEFQEVLELRLKVAVKSKDWPEVQATADRLLLACGPARVDTCRAHAVGALRQVASQKRPDSKAIHKKVEDLSRHDNCVISAERAARQNGHLPGCMDEAAGFYRRHKDSLMSARLLLAKAYAAQKNPRTPEPFEKAARACDEARCLSLRRRALKQAGWNALQAGDTRSAARCMIEDMGLWANSLPREQRKYARTTEVNKVCTAFDAKDGAGSCRRLEKQMLGAYVFTDFSTNRSATGLTSSTVKSVNEHYRVSLEECLSAEATRLRPPSQESYSVLWTVGNDGRVESVHLSKKYQDEGELAKCLRGAFGVWRYPRYEGELQHVEQMFTVSARQRS